MHPPTATSAATNEARQNLSDGDIGWLQGQKRSGNGAKGSQKGSSEHDRNALNESVDYRQLRVRQLVIDPEMMDPAVTIDRLKAVTKIAWDCEVAQNALDKITDLLEGDGRESSVKLPAVGRFAVRHW